MLFSKRALIALLAVVMLLDAWLTVLGQPDHYWENHTKCDELNPLGNVILSTHPNCFILLFGVWVLLILFLATRLPEPLDITVILLALGGHVWGSSCWVPSAFAEYTGVEANFWCFRLSYIAVIAAVAIFCVFNMSKSRSSAKFFAED